MADPDCLFCKIIAGEIPSTTVHEDDRTVAFMDVSPATRGHLLCVPRRHWSDVHEIPEDELFAVARTAKAMAGRVVERLDADGVNVIQNTGSAAWQSVFHYHVHVIPRYQGDPLRLPWIPTPGDADEIKATAAELGR